MALPSAFPYRDLIVLTTFSVVLGTLTIQGLTLSLPYARSIWPPLGRARAASVRRRTVLRCSGLSVAVVRCCIKNLSFSVNVLAQSRLDQRGSGDFPRTAVKIALSKSIISATVGEAGGSGSYKSREEPQFQQGASSKLQGLVSKRGISDRKGIFYEADAACLN
jgi:hypothetical protein